MPRRFCGFALVMLLSVANSPDIAARIDAATPVSRLPLRHVSVLNGLPHPAVYSVAQDAQGFIWLATGDGLARFDGHAFKVLRRDNAHSLAASGFGRIVRGHGNTLWLGTWGGGLQSLDTATGALQSVDLWAGNAAGGRVRVRAMAWQAEPGFLWVSVLGSGVFRLHVESGKIRHFKPKEGMTGSLAGINTSTLLVDRQNRLWAGGDGGLDRYDPSVEEFTHIADAQQLGSDRVHTIVQGPQGDLWIGSRGGGISRLDAGGRVIEQFRHHPEQPGSLKSDDISSLFFDHSGALWVGTFTHGIMRLLPGTRRFEGVGNRREKSSGLATRPIETFFEDGSQNLWIATRGSGAYWYDLKRKRLQAIVLEDPTQQALLEYDVRALAVQNRDGRAVIWIGTNGQGLIRFDPSAGSARQYRHDPTAPDSLAADVVFSLFVDRDNTLWVGTARRGLAKAVQSESGLRFQPLVYDNGPTPPIGSNTIRSMSQDAAGMLWLATYGGLYRQTPGADHDPIQRFVRVQDGSGLPIAVSCCVIHDRPGSVWIGSDSGVVHLDVESGRVQNISSRSASGLRSDLVLSLAWHAAHPRVLWVGTDYGLNRLNMDTGRVRQIGQSHGLPGDRVSAIVAMAAGDIWLHSGRGLTHISGDGEEIRNYGEFEVAPAIGFNQSALWKMPNGTLLFGGIGGLRRFDPRLDDAEIGTPPMVLTAVEINGVVANGSWLNDGPIELEYGTNTLSFDFAALDYSNPLAHNYAHRMVGLDPNWVMTSNGHHVRYANLAPGRYRFEFKANDTNGRWSAAPGSLEITITPPLWLETWFITLMSVLAASLLYGGIRFRIRSIQRHNLELRQSNRALRHEVRRRKHAEADVIQAQKMRAMGTLAGGVAHDFNNMLQSIQGYCDLALHEVGEQPKLVKYLNNAVRGIERAAAVARQLLTFSKPDQDRFTNLRLQEIVADVVTMIYGNIASGIRVSVDVDDACGPILADATQMHQVVLNLCTNALQAMGDRSGELSIRLYEVPGDREDAGLAADTLSGKLARLRIRDTGPGLSEQVAKRIFDPFFSTRAGAGGTGMGLAVVNSIVSASGGRIRASNNPDAGCSFIVDFPILAEGFEAELQREGVLESPEVSGLHVLLVDDSPTLANVLRLGLENHGLQVSAFTNPAEAISMFDADSDPYDVVVVDQRMPLISGLELARRLRRMRAELPIVLLTGSPPAEIRHDPDFVHVSVLLAKPVRIQTLLDELGRLVRPRRSR